MKHALAILLLMLCRLHAGDINATSLSSPGEFECGTVKVETQENAEGAIRLKVSLPDGGCSTTLERKSGEPFLVYWDKEGQSIWSATPTILKVTKFSPGRSEGYRYELACGMKALNPPAEFVEKVRALKIAGPDQD